MCKIGVWPSILLSVHASIHPLKDSEQDIFWQNNHIWMKFLGMVKDNMQISSLYFGFHSLKAVGPIHGKSYIWAQRVYFMQLLLQCRIFHSATPKVKVRIQPNMAMPYSPKINNNERLKRVRLLKGLMHKH